MDRRTSLKWMLAVLATTPAWSNVTFGAEIPRPAAKGYGTDPDLTKSYRVGELWPLTFTEAQRTTAKALCGVIIPADERSPSAADLEVERFIDEWISAPYPDNAADRGPILEGLAWMESESARRFGKPFAALDMPSQHAICDDICYELKAGAGLQAPAKFFARFRDLTADGFYTTPDGMKDLGFAGNTPSASFDGPPAEVLRIVGVN